jgi:hypothetical protein
MKLPDRDDARATEMSKCGAQSTAIAPSAPDRPGWASSAVLLPRIRPRRPTPMTWTADRRKRGRPAADVIGDALSAHLWWLIGFTAFYRSILMGSASRVSQLTSSQSLASPNLTCSRKGCMVPDSEGVRPMNMGLYCFTIIVVDQAAEVSAR